MIDCYHENSVKSFERCRRGVAPTFLLSGPKTKTPRNWKLFMYNDENKTQLIKLLLSEWRRPKYAARLDGRQLFFLCGEECICLTSNNGILVEARPEEDLFTSQEEADTHVILQCQHIAEYYPTSVIIVYHQTPTYWFFCQSQTILFDTGTGNKRRLLNVNDIVFVKGRASVMFFQLFIPSQVAIPQVHLLDAVNLHLSKFLRKDPNSFLLFVLWVRALRYKQKHLTSWNSLSAVCMVSQNMPA